MANNSKQQGAAMVELALTLPLMLILIGAIVEFSLLIYTWASGAEAARAGVRYAVVSNPVLDLSGLDCTDNSTARLDIDCGEDDCQSLVTEMQKVLPELQAANIHVTYECSRAGNPERPVSMKTPEVRVSIRDFEYHFLFPMIFHRDDMSLTMPDFTSTHTAEDMHTP